MSSNGAIILVIIAYLALMIFIGVYYGKKSDPSTSGFFLGGRKLGPLVAAMSAEASDMSSYLLMGLPGLAYISGTADVGWTVIGLALGTYFNWLLVAKRLRRYTIATNAITIPEFFSKRFRDKRGILSFIAGLVILIFFIPYTASGFKALGTLFSTLFGTDYHAAMLCGAIVVVIYTVLGGFLAVSTTDLIQSIVMTFALAAIVIFGINSAGGWAQVVDNARALPGYISMTATHNMATGESVPYGFITIISTMAWGLGYFGMPHILLRFMAIRKEEEITLSRRIASIWVVISMAIAVLIGIIGYSASLAGKIPTFTTSAESETVVIEFSNLLATYGFIPAIIAGLALAGILACTMSTADSQLLAAASSMSQNVMQDFLKLKLSEKASLIAARVTICVISVIAVFLAWNPDSSVFRIVSFAWAGFGGAFGPVMLLSLFWKRTNFAGALAGMVTGGATIFIWKFMVRPMGGAFDIYELLPAFIVGAVFTVIVSLITPAPSEEIVKEFESI